MPPKKIKCKAEFYRLVGKWQYYKNGRKKLLNIYKTANLSFYLCTNNFDLSSFIKYVKTGDIKVGETVPTYRYNK